MHNPHYFDDRTGEYRRGHVVDGKVIFDAPAPAPQPEPNSGHEIRARLMFGSGIKQNSEQVGITGDSFRRALNNTAGAIELEIIVDSKGGDLESAWQIVAMLEADQRMKTAIGLRRINSAASLVYMAGDSKRIHPDAVLMIHDPTRPGLTGTPDTDPSLALCKQQMLDFYCRRVPGITREQFSAWMSAETYFTAGDCIRFGLADSILNPNEWQVDAPPLAVRNRPHTVSASDVRHISRHRDWYDFIDARNHRLARRARGDRRQPIALPPPPPRALAGGFIFGCAADLFREPIAAAAPNDIRGLVRNELLRNAREMLPWLIRGEQARLMVRAQAARAEAKT